MQQVRRLLTYIIFIFVLLAAVWFVLPAALNHFLAPKIATALPFALADIHISTLNLHQLTADLTLGTPDSRALHIPKLTLNYSLSGLRAKRIDSISIDSPSVNLEINNGVLSLPGMREPAADEKSDGKDALILPALPIIADEIVLRNLNLTANTDGREHTLLADAVITPTFAKEETGSRLTAVTAKLHTAGAVGADLTARLTDNRDEQHIYIDGTVADLAALQALLPPGLDMRLAGYAQLAAEVSIAHFSQLSSYTGNATFPELTLQYGADGLVSEKNKPLQLHVSGTPETLHAELSHGLISGIAAGGIEATAEFTPAAGSLRVNGRLTPESLGAELAFTVTGDFSTPQPAVTYTVGAKNLTTPQFTAGSVAFSGTAKFSGGRAITSNQADITSLVLAGETLSVADVHAGLPLTLPLTEDTTNTPGKITVTGLRSPTMLFGNIAGTLTLAPEKAVFKLTPDLALYPGLPLSCNGEAAFTGDVNIDCSLPKSAIDSEQLAEDVPFPRDAHLTGNLAAELHLEVRKTIPSGNARLQLTDTTFKAGANQVAGINTVVEFPNLPVLESAPGQLCTIDSASAGKIALQDGRIVFRVESPESVFIEKSSFSWCSGKVETAGVRLSTAKKEVQTTLYCDRLNMVELLSQVGLADTEGEGSLNGRLPVSFNKDGIDIEDGFLFSTPGDSGIVHFKNTQQIREGLPNIDQAAYLDYAVKSLENFSYNWTKLTFAKDQKDLLVKMQLDGAPAAPLPFGYQDGNIVRTDKGAGIQHPIRLDVNFRFPLQDLFRYGKNVQSIMENL